MRRSPRAMMLSFGVVYSLSLAMAAPVAAQTDDFDIDAIADDVVAADPDALLEGLEIPMADRDLPDGFSDAEFVDPDDATAEMGLIGDDDLEGSLGAIGYTLTGDPEVLGGEQVIVSLQYVVFDEETVDADSLDDYITGAEATLDETELEDVDAVVEQVEINDVDAALITFVQEDAAASVVVQYLAVPVGNVFVFTSVTVASTDSVDADDVYDLTEELSLSSISHLGEVAADA